MSKNINNIDDLLRDDFEDFSSDVSPDVRAKVSNAVRSFNFFRFSPGNFNVFYLTAIIIGTSVILSFTTGIFTTGTRETNQTKPNNQKINSTVESSDKTVNSETDVQNNENTLFENKTESQSVFPMTKIINSSNTDGNDSQESIFQDGNVETLSNEIVETNSSTEGNKIVYDTIVETVKVFITDTITNEVHQTVEVKKNKKTKN